MYYENQETIAQIKQINSFCNFNKCCSKWFTLVTPNKTLNKVNNIIKLKLKSNSKLCLLQM